MPEETLEAKPSHIGPDHQLPPPARSRGVRVLVWVLILVGFGLIFWIVLHHKAAVPASRGRRALGGTVTLTTVTATKGDIGVYLQAIGTVTPVHTDTITSQASGLITQVNFREGQMVSRGERLIQIDPRIYRAQMLAAQGALERDTGLLAQARMDLARYQAAWARNAIAKQLLDDQEKIVQQYEGTVKADQGTLQLDRVNLSYCDITAPISGRVGLRLVDPGNVVQGGSTTPLVVITQLQPITIVFTIPEDNVGEVEDQIRQGKQLSVSALDRSDQHQLASGKLLTLDNQIDTTTGTLKLRAIFNNRDNALFPNLFVNARLLVRTINGATLIPSSAIQYNGDEAFVYVIKNETAHIVDITPGVTDSGVSEVIKGVQPGDVVADSSFEKLQNGSPIAISKTPILPPSTAGSRTP